MPYFDEVFVKNPSTALLEDRVRTEILTVEGVESVESISIRINKTTREATIKFVVVANGQIGQEEVIVNV